MLIAALLVTYGSRWDYLRRVIAKLRDDGNVSGVVVVDNASSNPVVRLVEESGFSSFVDVISNEQNVGSAKAFAQGLRRLIESGRFTHVYMLDDDNEPQQNAISHLIALQKLSGERSAQLSLRRDRVEFAQAELNRRPVKHRPNSFMGYEIIAAIKKRVKPRATEGRMPDEARSVLVDYAPYGGLFLPLSVIEEVGLPKESFVLYVDDHEFTTRIARAGIPIRLCFDSVVEDLEKSWHLTKSKNNIPPLLSTASSEFRVYYSVRNRVAFERDYLVESRPLYLLNVAGVLTIQSFQAVLAGASVAQVGRRLMLIRRAWSDGWNGRLGVCPALRLS